MIELDITGIISLAIAVSTFLLGRFTAGKESGREAGTVQTDIRYIRESIDRIETRLGMDVSRLDGRIDQVAKQAGDAKSAADKAAESAKSAHRRLDEIKRGH